MMSAPPRVNSASLELVRTALMVGVLMIGTVAWFIHLDAVPAGPNDVVALRWTVYALMAGALVSTLLLRPMIERAETFERAARLTIIAWTVAEAPAVAGAVHYLLTGSGAMFAAGTLVFVAALLLTGIPER